jgi:glycosyltransferase involved in cell wall biosynthesis
MSKNPRVSIHTVTNLSREKHLKILFDIIKGQTYKNIVEWNIVEGSQTLEESIYNKILVEEMMQNTTHDFTIKYIEFVQPNDTMGTLRNRANSNATGDIIVWMDDDDYYFNRRVEHAVDKLKNSSDNIVWCPAIYVHDIVLNKTVVANILVNNSIAFKKEYLKTHKYDEKIGKPNESNEAMSFVDVTKGGVISGELCLVKMIDELDRCNMKGVMIASVLQNMQGWKKLEDSVIEYLIPTSYYSRYKKIMVIEEELIYDIVYFTGGHGIEWDPTDMKLGGSEQAVVHLSKHWVKMGMKVAVYGNFKKDQTVDKVEYIQWTKFPYEKNVKILVAWRSPGVILLMNFMRPNSSKRLIADFHDNFSYTLANLDKKLLMPFLDKVDRYNVKSVYHKKCFLEFMEKEIPDEKFNIIVNGVRVEEFLNKEADWIRNPYRFCYCSSYDRGLETILEKIWPIIYKAEPRAELHVYYGMDYIYDDQFKLRLKLLLSQDGVMDHGRQSLSMVAREKYLSTFHLYLNDSIAEIDCISIRESLVTGCIPVISKFGVFAERHGLQFDWTPRDKDFNSKCETIANELVQYMKDTQLIFKAREQLMVSPTIIKWEVVAKRWLETL